MWMFHERWIRQRQRNMTNVLKLKNWRSSWRSPRVRSQLCSPSYQSFSSFLLVYSDTKRQLQKRLQDDKVSWFTSSAALFGKYNIARRITSCDQVIQSKGTVLSRALRSSWDCQSEGCLWSSLWFALFLSPHVNLTQNQGTDHWTLVNVEELQTEAVAECQITHDRLGAAPLCSALHKDIHIGLIFSTCVHHRVLWHSCSVG